MIVPMIKYSFILYHKDYEGFLAELQELGLVDITVSNWEPTENERRLMEQIDTHRSAMQRLGELRKAEGRQEAVPFDTPEETLAQYKAASDEIDRLWTEIYKTEKEIDDLKPWGNFSKTDMEQLKNAGVNLHFFTAFTKEYNARIEAWESTFALEKIAEEKGVVYFVVVTDPQTPHVEIDALEVKTPVATWQEREAHLASLHQALAEQQAILERAAEGYETLRDHGAFLREQLHLSKVNTSASRDAEGTLVVLEGWATQETQDKVDAFLQTNDSAYVVKSDPEEGDEPPVLLKNNKFARLFEVIGGFYSLPKYGTLDMTPFFAPFYMLFFGFCLADAGYGALFVIFGLIARFKLPQQLKGFASLVILCGISTIFFGLLTGNAFGIQLMNQPLFAGISKYMIDSNTLFMVAVAVGVVHILYAMGIKVWFTSKSQGFKYAASSLGWMIVIFSLLAAIALPMLGLAIPGYTMGSVPFWIVTGVGLFMMLFMNSPGKNPAVNFGLGLWNTYNDVTGLLSDVLSYIRLFALGLSGGILALVFNRLAMEMSPDIVVLKQIIMILILAVGQGLTLFMATLSAFVHPLRLTFVEFYKNAGFVDGGRPFDPLKKEAK